MTDSTNTVVSPTTAAFTAVDVHDRVAEAYFGKLGVAFMRETQERIHWICEQVSGQTVLDVGCSQGITSILLGREGKRVLAIDADVRSIDEAKALLGAEPDRVQKLVDFVHADFLTLSTESATYDTIVISEVLEHLVQPAAFVEAAAHRLKPGGTLVVTVPFGVNDFIDHKRTYYLLEPYRLLSSDFDVTEVAILGKWLGLSAKRSSGGKTSLPPAAFSNDLIERLEKAFYQIERKLRDETAELRTRLTDANLKYRNVTEQVATVKQRVAQEEQARKQALEQLAALQAQYQKAQGEGKAEQLRGRELASQMQALQANLAERSGLLDAVSAQKAELDGALMKAREEAAARSAKLEEKNQDLSLQLTAQRQALIQQSETWSQERDSLTERLKDEQSRSDALRERLQQELAQAESCCRDADARAAKIRSELEALQESARHLSSELDTERALHRSHQNSTEQVKVQLLQARRAGDELRTQMGKLELEKLAAEDRVARTRAMTSFRLGYTLLHGFKSWHSVRKLPGDLWQLHRDVRRKRAVKTGGEKAFSARALSAPVGKILPLSPATPPQPLTSELQMSERPFSQALKDMKVACIMDEFTFSSYAPECNLLPLSVDRWQEELEAFVPDLLFIESAWRGRDDRWGSKVGHLSSEVMGILAWCRARQIPSVFWNKEDPIHFETFLSTARLFDHVFTTDIDCIQRYKGALGHDRVYLLPFACQPAASNPIEKYARKDAFCFAGAYYVRYPERTRDLGNFMLNLAEYRPVEIYDRNFGKNDLNYQFPADYQPFIVGTLPFEQIDKAYKGYRYAINLNSIKQSQSMFARRVFELLASNTITISNFSRGVRLLFGDLVVTTDSGQEIVRRLQKLCDDPVNERKFRLAGLRKVMRDHTYQDRLAYVVNKVRGKALGASDAGLLPTVTMTGYAKNPQQFNALLASFERQTHNERLLLVVTPNDYVQSEAPRDSRVQILTAREADGRTLGDLAPSSPWVAGIVPDDYYGPNYLLDMALATRYSEADAFGKPTHHIWSIQNGLSLASPDAQYRPHSGLQARCALVNANALADVPLREWVISLYTRPVELGSMLGLDEFNYCKNGAESPVAHTEVDDLDGLDAGMTMQELMQRAEAVRPEADAADTEPLITGAELAAYFKVPSGKLYQANTLGGSWVLSSELGDGKHEYLYSSTDLKTDFFGDSAHLRFHLDVTPGLNVQLVVLFLDAHKQRISHVVKPANRNQEAAVPAGTAWMRLGIRLYGSGEARVNALVLGHRVLRPATVLGRAEHLLLTNHYPSYDDLYRNGFVHSRVQAYRERGVEVDVFRIRGDEGMSYHEYEDVDVMSGSSEALRKLLELGRYKSVLVHFLSPAMWDVLKEYTQNVKVIVWVHGAEIQPYHRREYNHETEHERAAAKAESELRMVFWRGLLQKGMPANMKLVFVSRYFAEEVMTDLGFRFSEDAYSIIHNPIDTDLFTYQPKPVEQRKKILSIRPYTSRTYANDLSVAAILKLSTKPLFSELEFHIIGDGKLFDSTLAPLRNFKNVIIDRRFLDRNEIARIHKNYGVFLCPSRMDTQGVSRDEAMASGLVPVSNAVAAVSEFVTDGVGLLAAAESSDGLADAISKIFEDPDLFSALSSSSANYVRGKSAKGLMVERELLLFI